MQEVTDSIISRFPSFMASTTNARLPDIQRRPLQSSKSWSRIESESTAIPEADNPKEPSTLKEKGLVDMRPDLFEKSSEDDERKAAVEGIAGRLSADFDELPIELVSLTDRLVSQDVGWSSQHILTQSSFIDSLSAKVHRAPPSIDKLSSLFQDFYAIASTHINTHISTLSSRQHRGNSSAPSMSSLSSTASKFRA